MDFIPVCSILLRMYYKYIYVTQVYTCYRNTVFYFDTSYSLSSQHVSAPRAIMKNQETLRGQKALRIQRKQNSDCNTENYGVKNRKGQHRREMK
jgi:hypothetical protein